MKIYNSMTRKKEEFKPLKKGEISIYVCGPTVYDHLHIGNFRGAVFFHLVASWFEKKSYKVTYVYNYTDIDDKIIDRAKKENKDISEISEKYIKSFEEDYKKLSLRKHDFNPRATNYIEEMIKWVDQLMKEKKAYPTSNGVYFDVSSFSSYGKLSNKTLEDLSESLHTEIDDEKKHPSDFALWKLSKKDEPGWETPWGYGRPGWHLECSVMNAALFGKSIDIHGGGLDLVFPHHENEIAQSESFFKEKFVSYWMHSNMIQFNSQKMSKSLGNVKQAKQFMEEFDEEILKLLFLSSHYRSLIDFNEKAIERAFITLSQFYSSLSLAKKITEKMPPEIKKDSFKDKIDQIKKDIEMSLDDDFNTPQVFAKLFELLKLYNSLCRNKGVSQKTSLVSYYFLEFFSEISGLLSLFNKEASSYLKSLDTYLLKKLKLDFKEIEEKINLRKKFRLEKNYEKSDEIRDELFKLGILISDEKDGSVYWEVDKSRFSL